MPLAPKRALFTFAELSLLGDGVRAEIIGGDKIEVSYIVRGDQDAIAGENLRQDGRLE